MRGSGEGGGQPGVPPSPAGSGNPGQGPGLGPLPLPEGPGASRARRRQRSHASGRGAVKFGAAVAAPSFVLVLYPTKYTHVQIPRVAVSFLFPRPSCCQVCGAEVPRPLLWRCGAEAGAAC